MVFFLTRSKRLPFYPEHQTSPATHKTFYSVDVVDPSPMMKQLMHKADHSPQFSAEVTDQYSCNCASAECLHGAHRDNFTFYHCVGGMTSMSMWTHLCPAETESDMESKNIVSFYNTVLCQNTESCYLMISIEYGGLETSVHVGFPYV